MLNTTLARIIAEDRLASLHADAELHRTRRTAARAAAAPASAPTPAITRALRGAGGSAPRAARARPRAAA